MKHLLFFLLIYLSMGYLPIGLAQTSSSITTKNLEDLNWLVGCWITPGKSNITNEMWLKPHHNVMLGVAQTYNSEKTLSFEYTRIEIRNDALLFIAKPSNQAEATFNCIKLEKNSIAFENKDHDFPQIVSYTLIDEKNLAAFISGSYNGKTKKIDFKYKKEDCGN